MASMEELKARLREEVWRKLEEHEVVVAPRPCRGKIPLFLGSRVAAMKVAKRGFFRDAEVVYSTPDPPQRPLREAALLAGKKLVMALPMLKSFVVVDGGEVPRHKAGFAATLRGAAAYGRRVRIPEGLRVDVFIVGSVAVDKQGGRLGRGDGLHDLEYAVLRELRLVDDDTVVITTVHDLQVVPEVPMHYHDVPVDYIATPSLFIRAEGGYTKPRGVFWDLVDTEMMERIQLLKLLAGLA